MERKRQIMKEMWKSRKQGDMSYDWTTSYYNFICVNFITLFFSKETIQLFRKFYRLYGYDHLNNQCYNYLVFKF
ncbi:hypothetical protein GCM10008967_41070 [Bacillus carboniphilus]|uniref:Uncharacterized protein n=1 Tax=Bacillus carboniphilus TaxID=86663 RepID=A0ABP3GLZ0_9BACI